MKMWPYWTSTRPFSKCWPRKMSNKNIYISIMQLLIALYIHLVVTNSWVPPCPIITAITFSLSHYKLSSKTYDGINVPNKTVFDSCVVFVTNNDADAEMPWLQDHPMDISTEWFRTDCEMTKIGTMFKKLQDVDFSIFMEILNVLKELIPLQKQVLSLQLTAMSSSHLGFWDLCWRDVYL